MPLLLVLLVSYPSPQQKLLPDQCQKNSYFFLVNFSFRYYVLTLHFKLTCVCGVRQEFSIILLHAIFQFSQHHWLKRLSFPHWVFLASLSNISWLICEGLFLGSQFYYSGLCVHLYTSVFLSWPLYLCNIVWNQVMQFFQLILLSQCCFRYFRSLAYSALTEVVLLVDRCQIFVVVWEEKYKGHLMMTCH